MQSGLTMKISDALLFIFREAGGELRPGQIDMWLKELAMLGMIETVPHGEVGKRELYLGITDKGREHLEKRGL